MHNLTGQSLTTWLSHRQTADHDKYCKSNYLKLVHGNVSTAQWENTGCREFKWEKWRFRVVGKLIPGFSMENLMKDFSLSNGYQINPLLWYTVQKAWLIFSESLSLTMNNDSTAYLLPLPWDFQIVLFSPKWIITGTSSVFREIR